MSSSVLQQIVDELFLLFPDFEPNIIKEILIDCNYDKNACAEVLLLAQESGMQEIPERRNEHVDHHNDVTLVYKDQVITVNRDELSKYIEPVAKPEVNRMNEQYKRYAMEDEMNAMENQTHPPEMIHTTVDENDKEKENKPKLKFRGKSKKGSYKQLDNED